ncbi:MAG: NADH-quinone oxidoreductase subunit L [Acidimicrobiales bacterium]
MLHHVWIIPALCALSFVLILTVGKRTPGKGHFIGIGFVAIAFVLSVVTGVQWISRTGDHVETQAAALADVNPTCSQTSSEIRTAASTDTAESSSAESSHAESTGAEATGGEAGGEAEHLSRPIVSCLHWYTSGSIDVTVGTYLDGQSALMLVVVTFISLLVHIFSTDYVAGDRRYTHYFGFLSLFTASMLFFVLAENTLQMIVGWELVGVCSFALIGHWWEDKNNSDAALKAFLTNRVGDMGLMIGVIILYFVSEHRFDILDITTRANDGSISHKALLLASICLITAVMSKSGQFILHTWLPDAMAGPTPVSALIHAATMVVAGIYMVARLFPVFFNGLSIGGSSINYLAVVGSVTALFGALLGFVQKDIKKTLAYSTVSQLGFMVAALGVGAWTAALFHLFTHAMFKACLFLGAGSLSHANHHSFNMVDDMGGLRKVMPKTFWTYVIAMLSLCGIFPLAGFWSKDEILAGTGGWNAANGAYTFTMVMLLIAAFCTAAYMTRTVWYAFFGEYRGHHHPHESGPRITIPLILLAIMGAIAGFANLPAKFWGGIEFGSLALKFEHIVEPVGIFFPGHEQGYTHAEFNGKLALVATIVGLLGIALPAAFYTGKLPFLVDLTKRSKVMAFFKRILENKYYLDWLYTDVIVHFVKLPLAKATYWFNQNAIDGVVNGAGRSAVGVGRWVYSRIDQGAVDRTVNGIATVAGATGGELRRAQTGRVQQYAALFFAAAALLAGVIVVVVGG